MSKITRKGNGYTPDIWELMPIREYRCEYSCGKVFKNRIPYEMHLNKIHGAAMQMEKEFYMCPVVDCEYVAARMPLLRRHYQFHHMEKKVKCIDCKRKFLTERQFEKHKCDKSIYICDTCSKTFKLRSMQIAHEKQCLPPSPVNTVDRNVIGNEPINDENVSKNIKDNQINDRNNMMQRILKTNMEDNQLNNDKAQITYPNRKYNLDISSNDRKPWIQSELKIKQEIQPKNELQNNKSNGKRLIDLRLNINHKNQPPNGEKCSKWSELLYNKESVFKNGGNHNLCKVLKTNKDNALENKCKPNSTQSEPSFTTKFEQKNNGPAVLVIKYSDYKFIAEFEQLLRNIENKNVQETALIKELATLTPVLQRIQAQF